MRGVSPIFKINWVIHRQCGVLDISSSLPVPPCSWMYIYSQNMIEGSHRPGGWGLLVLLGFGLSTGEEFAFGIY